jgi:plasmid stabilization system protein ParE
VKYTVTWTPAALDELARMWNEAADRDAVAAASNEMDRLLASVPNLQGESRGGNIRILFVGPIGADYEVLDADRIVRVLTVWRVK